MKLKVAIIDPLGAHGSSHHFYLFGQIDGLKNNGVDVRLYTNSETHDPKIKGVKFFQTFGNLFSSRYKLISGLKYILGGVRSILHARFYQSKIFHFHVFHMDILLLMNLVLVKLIFGKSVLTIHDVTSFSQESNYLSIQFLIYKISDLVLTHNKFSEQQIIDLAPFLKHKIFIVPHGNYIPFINIRNDQSVSRNYLSLPKGKKILLFFGMIKKVKGLEILLESLNNILAENPNVILLIAGKPWKNDFAVYQKIIDQRNLSDNVILHTKFIPHSDIEHYYCASDLVVLPYKKIYQSGVLMMTLSYERPVLVSDLPPIKEIIIDNENGFLFASEDSNDLAEKITVILSEKENLERVRKNGARLIKIKFSWNEIGRLTKKAYEIL